MKQLSEDNAYENYYQFVGATKYRKPLFHDNEILHRLSCIIADIFNKKEEFMWSEFFFFVIGKSEWRLLYMCHLYKNVSTT